MSDRNFPITAKAGGTAKTKAGKFRRLLRLLALLVLIVSVSLIVYSVVSPPGSRIVNGPLANQMGNVRQLVLACLKYARDNGNTLPTTLSDLVPDYLDDDSLLFSDLTVSEVRSPFWYRPYLSASGELRVPLIVAPESYRGKRVVGYSSGRVSALRESNFTDELLKIEGWVR